MEFQEIENDVETLVKLYKITTGEAIELLALLSLGIKTKLTKNEEIRKSKLEDKIKNIY